MSKAIPVEAIFKSVIITKNKGDYPKIRSETPKEGNLLFVTLLLQDFLQAYKWNSRQ